MMSCFYSLETDPYVNLAIEYKLLHDSNIQHACLIYRNHPSIVLGHFQNPWLECNFPLLNRYGIDLVRRRSGGGAVYHDLHNFNYAFLGQEEFFSLDKNYDVLHSFFERFNLMISKDKFFSLFIDGHKCSGTAFKNIKGRKLQHGTILVEGDASLIHSLLTPNNVVNMSKSISSNRADIKSLREWGVDCSLDKLIDDFFLQYRKIWKEVGTTEIVSIDRRYLAKQYEEIELLKSDDWLYGKIPLTNFYNPYLDCEFKIIKNRVYFEQQDVSWHYFIEKAIYELANKKALSKDRAISEIIKV